MICSCGCIINRSWKHKKEVTLIVNVFKLHLCYSPNKQQHQFRNCTIRQNFCIQDVSSQETWSVTVITSIYSPSSSILLEYWYRSHDFLHLLNQPSGFSSSSNLPKGHSTWMAKGSCLLPWNEGQQYRPHEGDPQYKWSQIFLEPIIECDDHSEYAYMSNQ